MISLFQKQGLLEYLPRVGQRASNRLHKNLLKTKMLSYYNNLQINIYLIFRILTISDVDGSEDVDAGPALGGGGAFAVFIMTMAPFCAAYATAWLAKVASADCYRDKY